ncbi:hypothetical protein TRIP_B350297 [uncultured Desulfatiglans sp.]|nr:hypothetical protein TRIP_B350297 [uncultured Desulfatiglans sp.]
MLICNSKVFYCYPSFALPAIHLIFFMLRRNRPHFESCRELFVYYPESMIAPDSIPHDKGRF